MWGDQRIARLCSLALVAGLTTSVCSPPAVITLHEIAEEYVRVTLQIAQHRPALVDAYVGSADRQPGARLPVAQLATSVDQLRARLASVRPATLDATERPRHEYLQGQLRALSLITRRLLGERTSFASEIEAAFGARMPPVDEQATNDARAALARELPGGGTLEARYFRFRRQFEVDPQRTEAVVRAAIEECRAATTSYLTLPADERLTLSFDEAIEWGAYARYLGRHETAVRIGTPRGHDVAALLRMACHETYAGHHAQHILIDDALVRGRRWIEFELTPAFGPHKLITEGAAEVGVDLALPEPVRARIYRDRLLPLAGLPTATATRLARVETLASSFDIAVPGFIAGYLDNEVSAADTAKRLAASALLPGAAQFVGFAERHRTSAVVYPVGRAVVSEWVNRAPTVEQRWRRLQDLFTRTPFALNSP